MNIFVLDEKPWIAAEYHCDKHVVKMILETAQMLSTAHHVLDGDKAIDGIYRKTHVNHPCSIWARETTSNYQWLLDLGFQLCFEYTRRYGKRHKTQDVLNKLVRWPDNLKGGKLTPFALAMPDEYKDNDPVASYQRYYRYEKRNIAEYKHSKTPDFML